MSNEAGDKKSEMTEVTFKRFQVSGKRYGQSNFISAPSQSYKSTFKHRTDNYITKCLSCNGFFRIKYKDKT